MELFIGEDYGIEIVALSVLVFVENEKIEGSDFLIFEAVPTNII